MSRNDLYTTWATQVRQRYRPPPEAAPPQPAPPGEDRIAALANAVAGVRNECADLRGKIEAESGTARAALAADADRLTERHRAQAVRAVRPAYPDLFHHDPTPQQLAGRTAPRTMFGQAHADRREGLNVVVARAAALVTGGEGTAARAAALVAERAEAAAGLDAVRDHLRARHRVGPAVFAGLESVGADHTFRDLVAGLLTDARLEAAWDLDRAPLDRFRTVSQTPPAAPARPDAPPGPGRPPARTDAHAAVVEAAVPLPALSRHLHLARETARLAEAVRQAPADHLPGLADQVRRAVTYTPPDRGAERADLFPALDRALRVGVIAVPPEAGAGLAELVGRFTDEWLTPEFVQMFEAEVRRFTTELQQAQVRVQALAGEVAAARATLATLTAYRDLLDTLEPGFGEPAVRAGA